MEVMSKAIGFALASTLVLVGCGSKSSPLGAGGSTSSAASSQAGAGGGAGGSSGAGGGGGGEGGAGCVMGSISIDGDGPTNHFNAACMGFYGTTFTSHANGYLGYPTHTSPDAQLYISGCPESTTPPMFGSLSLTVPQTGVGNATTGTASYANATGTFKTDTAVTVMITQISSSVVQGSYTATVSSTSNGTKMLSGTFDVCRVPNYRPP
jgi:hypothetical protein